MPSLLQARLFRKQSFCNITVQTFHTENYQSWDFQNVVYLKNRLNVKLVNFKDTIRRQATFLKAHQTFNLFVLKLISFINYRKSKTILKSSLSSHVYWNILYICVQACYADEMRRRRNRRILLISIVVFFKIVIISTIYFVIFSY